MGELTRCEPTDYKEAFKVLHTALQCWAAGLLVRGQACILTATAGFQSVLENWKHCDFKNRNFGQEFCTRVMKKLKQT